MQPQNLIGKTVDIKSGYYTGHWGIVRAWDGESYHVGGGSIGEGVTPIFDRDEIKVRRTIKG